MRHDEVLAECRARAHEELAQPRLVVDYYRIRRRICYPLQMRALPIPEFPPHGENFHYPWATWLSWRMEERLGALGWWGHWSGDEACRRVVAEELACLASWPRYDQYAMPDLSSAHLLRLLLTAARHWPWLGESLRASVHAACARQLDHVIGWFDRERPGVTTAADLLGDARGARVLANIPVIGTLVLAAGAQAAKHAEAARLHQLAAAHLLAVLESRTHGLTEAASYDGYVLDFALWWLQQQPEPVRRTMLDHPQMQTWLRQPAALALPGDAAAVPVLGDVEPLEMPFHFTASARGLALCGDPLLRWHLEQAALSTLRVDALAVLHDLEPGPTEEPSAGARRVHYAVTLRSGWSSDDLTVAVSAATADFGHLHFDGGSLVLAAGRHWIIDDPGYQQYLPKQERTFAIGPRSHNAPVINGQAQSVRRPRLLKAESLEDHTWLARLDLTACYDPALGLREVVRSVWLLDRRAVVVADVLRAAAPVEVAYHWYGHPQAAWWVQDGSAVLQRQTELLWITAPGLAVQDKWVDRLPGSRGHLTLSARHEPADSAVHWWVFSRGQQPVTWSCSDDRRTLRALGRSLTV